MGRVGGARHQRATREYMEADAPEYNPSKHAFGRVVEIRGKGLVQIELPALGSSQAESKLGEPSSGPATLVTPSVNLAVLPPKFRSVLWLRRGAFVLLSTLDSFAADATKDESGKSSSSKVTHVIEALLTREHVKQFEQRGVWPRQFSTKQACEQGSSSELDAASEEEDQECGSDVEECD